MNAKTSQRLSLSLPQWVCDEIDRLTQAQPTHENRSRTVVDLLMRQPEFQAAAPKNASQPDE